MKQIPTEKCVLVSSGQHHIPEDRAVDDEHFENLKPYIIRLQVLTEIG
jgi:hypothetical protein